MHYLRHQDYNLVEKKTRNVAFLARSDYSHRDKTHISEERLFMFAVFGTNSVSYHCLECDWVLHAPITIAQIYSQPVKGTEPAQLAEFDCVYVKYSPPVSYSEHVLGDAS